jgi:membrane protease YdiL (CAAX protease family)
VQLAGEQSTNHFLNYRKLLTLSSAFLLVNQAPSPPPDFTANSVHRGFLAAAAGAAGPAAAAGEGDVPAKGTKQEQQQQQQPKGNLPMVTWGLNVTLTVLVLWLMGFWAAAYVAVPALLDLLPLDALGRSPQRVQALKHLLLDLMQLGATALILGRSLRDYAPRTLGLFSFWLRPVRGWALPSLAGAATFPIIHWVHKAMVALFAGSEAAAGTVVAADAAAQPVDWAARAMWFAVLGLCAPLWEEAMFRGFLLPSLARHLR